MSSNSMNQSLEDQFIHWLQEMEEKQEEKQEEEQEEQARQMKELQGHAKRLQRENDQLWAQIEKKISILENMYEIAVELCIQLLAIRGRSPLYLTMSIP